MLKCAIGVRTRSRLIQSPLRKIRRKRKRGNGIDCRFCSSRKDVSAFVILSHANDLSHRLAELHPPQITTLRSHCPNVGFSMNLPLPCFCSLSCIGLIDRFHANFLHSGTCSSSTSKKHAGYEFPSLQRPLASKSEPNEVRGIAPDATIGDMIVSSDHTRCGGETDKNVADTVGAL